MTKGKLPNSIQRLFNKKNNGTQELSSIVPIFHHNTN